MNVGKTVFSQIMDYLPIKAFRACVQKYHGHHKVKTFSCLETNVMSACFLVFRPSIFATMTPPVPPPKITTFDFSLLIKSTPKKRV